MSFTELVLDGFDSLSPELDRIYQSTLNKNLDDWMMIQKASVTGAGAAAVAIPGLHLLGMAADIAFLMNRMSTCSFGVGAILSRSANLGNILEKEDFPLILGLWAGDDDISTAVKAKACSVGVVATTGIVQTFLAKEMAKACGALVGKKLGGKLGAKIGVKFAGKLGGKTLAGFVPFLGPAVSGGINFYFLSGISNSAVEYYLAKTGLNR